MGERVAQFFDLRNGPPWTARSLDHLHTGVLFGEPAPLVLDQDCGVPELADEIPECSGHGGRCAAEVIGGVALGAHAVK